MSNNLDLSQIAAAQRNKHTTANDQVGEIDAAITEPLQCDVSSDNVALTAEQYRRALWFHATGAATDGRTVTLQAIRRFALIANFSTTHAVAFALGTSSVELAPAEDADTPAAALIYTDGAADGLYRVSGGAGGGASHVSELNGVDLSDQAEGQMLRFDASLNLVNEDTPYDLAMYLPGTFSGAALMAQIVFDRSVLFPDGLAGSRAYAGTTATGETVLDVLRNGSPIGTITFAMGNHGTIVDDSVTRGMALPGPVLAMAGDDNDHRVDLGSVAAGNPLMLDGDHVTWMWDATLTGFQNNAPRLIDKSTGGVGADGWALYPVNVGSVVWALAIGGSEYRLDPPGHSTGTRTRGAITKEGTTRIALRDPDQGAPYVEETSGIVPITHGDRQRRHRQLEPRDRSQLDRLDRARLRLVARAVRPRDRLYCAPGRMPSSSLARAASCTSRARSPPRPRARAKASSSSRSLVDRGPRGMIAWVKTAQGIVAIVVAVLATMVAWWKLGAPRVLARAGSGPGRAVVCRRTAATSPGTCSARQPAAVRQREHAREPSLGLHRRAPMTRMPGPTTSVSI